jgi:hypothetical protein
LILFTIFLCHGTWEVKAFVSATKTQLEPGISSSIENRSWGKELRRWQRVVASRLVMPRKCVKENNRNQSESRTLRLNGIP